MGAGRSEAFESSKDDGPVSHWQPTARQPILASDSPPTADVVVVGGGVLGAATAYGVARTGARPVLVERTAPAHGATGRDAGCMTPVIVRTAGGAVRAGAAVAARCSLITNAAIAS